jgi:hypothetical protein
MVKRCTHIEGFQKTAKGWHFSLDFHSWEYRNNGASSLWMHSLLSATLDSSRRNNYSIPEPQRSASHTKSRAQPAQCYLQCAPSLASATHSRQAYKKHLILTQEIKRDIINHRVNLPPSARQVTNPQWLMAHLVSTFWRLSSYFQYISLGKFANAILALQQMQERTLDHPWPEYGTASFWTPLLPPIPREIVTGISYPMPTLDGTRFIHQHPQHLTAYSYITTHLTLPSHYWYNWKGKAGECQKAFFSPQLVWVAQISFYHFTILLFTS